MIFVFRTIFFFISVKLIPNEDSNGKSGIFLQKTVTENQIIFLQKSIPMNYFMMACNWSLLKWWSPFTKVMNFDWQAQKQLAGLECYWGYPLKTPNSCQRWRQNKLVRRFVYSCWNNNHPSCLRVSLNKLSHSPL